jgi:hypothetical protein
MDYSLSQSVSLGPFATFAIGEFSHWSEDSGAYAGSISERALDE